MLFQIFCHFWILPFLDFAIFLSCTPYLPVYWILYRLLEIHFSFSFADKSFFLKYLTLPYRINNGVHGRNPDFRDYLW
jgi:hypothetical protein